jgi:ankyrin repeat protein
MSGERLFKGAKEGKVEEVNYCLNNGVNIDSKDGNGFTALMVAATRGKQEVIKVLLDKGAYMEAISNVSIVMLCLRNTCTHVQMHA